MRPLIRHIHCHYFLATIAGVVSIIPFVATSAVAAKADADSRETLICYLSWFSPIGKLNGTRQWSAQGWHYQRELESDDLRNHPLPFIPDAGWPASAPAVGSQAYYDFQRTAAGVTQKQIRDAAFDVLLFDMLPMPDYDPAKPLTEFNSPLAHFKTFLVWLREAEKNGVKLGPMPDIANQSGDYPQRRNPTVAEWTRVLTGMLAQTPDSPALWKINGKPVVTHFGTDSFHGSTAPDPAAPKPDGGWRQILNNLRKTETAKPFYFIADIRPHNLVPEWNKIADAAWIFAPAAPAAALPDMQRIIAANLKIPLMWTVSPGYYRAGIAYTQPDFARIHNTYIAAMRAKAKRICVLTWNDFEEDTDIVPSANKGRALLDIFAYYNRWFKDGVPPPPDDRVIIALPMRIPERITTKSPSYGRLSETLKPGSQTTGKWSSPSWQPKVFYWANVTKPTDLAIDGVGTIRIPTNGLHHGELGLIAPGPVHVALNGKSLQLTPIQQTRIEQRFQGEGGLEYRYIDISAKQ
ncbi:hypothetical protein OpiT1DRAFT_00055 [Opitutaceae bacterium TAV1]|nr:hypothetical protein OpiT1DRAFT_00055 [Opitutaceae bacterium TAV1]